VSVAGPVVGKEETGVMFDSFLGLELTVRQLLYLIAVCQLANTVLCMTAGCPYHRMSVATVYFIFVRIYLKKNTFVIFIFIC
jgi:hypothetical protein